MSTQNNLKTNQKDQNNDTTRESQIGAACNEIITETNNSSGFILPPINEANPISVEDFEVDDNLPLPPQYPGTSSSLIELNQDLDHRRYSYAFPPNSEEVNPQRNRVPSMPSILPSSHDDDVKKFTTHSSRRSSFESAYHSHVSDQSPRPTSNASSRTNHNETLSYRITDSISHDNISSDNHRRDSLSYEAIREYFLINNPYRNITSANNGSIHCNVHHTDTNDEGNCPVCLNTNNNNNNDNHHLSSQFRTAAHQQIVQNQFEELLDIPDPRTSRSTSIDLFGGIDLSSLQPKDDDNDANDDNYN